MKETEKGICPICHTTFECCMATTDSFYNCPSCGHAPKGIDCSQDIEEQLREHALMYHKAAFGQKQEEVIA